MASALPAETRLSGILSCAICFESKQGRNPKGLHCFHSLCRSCLQGWQGRLHNKNKIDCPVCRRSTKLPKNGIDGLADDFKVAELIDLMKCIGDPFVCQGCVSRGTQSRAKIKCITCDRRLCHECYEFHKSSDFFDNHEIATELCELHGNKVTHVCVTCFLGLCVDCIFSRIHEKHDTCKLAEGLERMKKLTEEDHEAYIDICDSRIAQIGRDKEMKEDNARRQISILKGISALMKRDTDAIITSIQKKYISKQKADIESWVDAEKKKYPSIDLINCEGDISKLSFLRTELRQKLQQLRDADIKTAADSMYQNIDCSYFAKIGLTSKLNTELFDRYKKHDQRFGRRPMKIWSNTFTTDIIGLEVLEDYSALVAHVGKDHVVRYDTNGKVMGVYHLTGHGNGNKVQRITTHDGNLHIFCGDNQSLVTITTDTYERHNRIIYNLSGGINSLVYDPVGARFLFGKNGGKVLICKKDNTDATPCSLAYGRLRVVKHQGCYKIIIARPLQGEVLVYDIHGVLLSTFRECSKRDKLRRPRDVAMFDQEILLVEDSLMQRVSMFNLSDDSFVGHLLSGTYDLTCPRYICCKYPYLWLASSRGLQLFTLD